MSNVTQCPSTIGKKSPPEVRTIRRDATGAAYWRSLDELAGTTRFRDFAEREFPALASELTGESRRHFLKVMGASLALAGAATIPGCRRPDHKILPFTRQPEDQIAGKATYYATARPLPGGGAEGLLVETHSGRPTKIEGNPLHPGSLGKSSLRAQSAVLDIYDPERLTQPTTLAPSAGAERVPATWGEYDAAARGIATAHDADNGAGLFILCSKITSPTRDRVRDRLLERWPEASWLPYEAIDRENEIDGTRAAFGAPHRAVPKLDAADVILTLDADILAGEHASLSVQRGFASGRRVRTVDDPMNRLYAVESSLTATGMAADHRLALKPSQVAHYAAALAQAVIARRGQMPGVTSALAAADHLGALQNVERKWIDAVAEDLVSRAPRAVVIAGESQPPAVHALVAAVNTALGAVGRTIDYRPLAGDAAVKSSDSMSRLASAARRGEVRTLLCLDRNPLYDAPADHRQALADAWDGIGITITLATGPSETERRSAWSLNAAHFLEAWGDVADWDGTLSPVQPMIKPLYGGRSEIELLSGFVGGMSTDGYELCRATWRGRNADALDRRWRRALHDGLVAGSATSASAPSPRAAPVADAARALAPDAGSLEAVFVADTRLWDGARANNGWLQEIPDPISKVAWDNPVFVSPRTAKDLGLSGWLGRIGEQTAPVVKLTVDGRAVEVPVWPVPGVADGAVIVVLGGGRTACGRVGEGVGADTYAVRSSRAHRVAAAVRLEDAGRDMPIACVQDHGTMEAMEGTGERPLLREFDVQAFRKHGAKKEKYKGPYGRARELSMAQKLGAESHAPTLETIYQDDQRFDYSKGQQWGMSIDLTTCIGCNVCTIACQAENNIPVVGKTEVNKGREMHWIRVDRYFRGDPEQPHTVSAGVMPVACVHCENAPCEAVCPVNATVHSPNGLNVMAYNRCIGTRYCSNNCPYKVRRFNFFDYATKRMGGDNPLKGVVTNENFVPPRLRESNPEVRHMVNNPHVTVRERGVMEKCTYCIQRINEARIEYTRLEDHDRIPDGKLQTACQQACPVDAIVFGDINDPDSRVKARRDSTRSYLLLDYLNTLPRTTYEARLRNPNPAIRQPVVDPFHHGDDHGGDHGDSHTRAPARDPDREPGHIMSLGVLPTGATIGGRA